jgi:hypothetical protein
MTLVLRALLLSTLLGACQPDASPPLGDPPSQPLPLYQGALWTKPAGSTHGATECGIRRSLPDCDLFPEPSPKAVAVEGRRLVVLMERDRVLGGWDLVVSDDLGMNVRRFAMDPLGQPDTDGSLHLKQGRIFLLAAAPPALAGVRLFEVDATSGKVTGLGGGQMMASTATSIAADGALVAVAFARNQAPQVISLTRFDPRTGTIDHNELPCSVPGCDPAGLSRFFLSSDGERFDILTESPLPTGPSCLVTVRGSTRSVTSQCFPRLPDVNRWPLSAIGGAPFDHQLSSASVEEETLLWRVNHHWLPAGEPRRFGPDQLHLAGDSFLVYRDPGSDGRLLRLRAGGQLQETSLPGCVNLGPYDDGQKCPRAVSFQALAGDQVLFITRRDEHAGDDDRSRQLFEVSRSAAPFSDFSP